MDLGLDFEEGLDFRSVEERILWLDFALFPVANFPLHPRIKQKKRKNS